MIWGVDWYPEQWDEAKWEGDVDRMAAQGFSAARIMEFAWSAIEPEPGRFDFSLFDRAIGLLESRGLGVVLGTPTATFPAWLLDAPGGVLAVHPSGSPRDFGARRMGCLNAPAYKEAALRVVRAIAERYGPRGAVVGWQVDNEIGHEGSDRCCCGHCRAAWRAWLERRYGSVGALNEAWGTIFWGSTYARFDQVPVPRAQPATGHNPALLLDYDRFSSDSAVAWAAAQVAVLRGLSRPGQWITTNLYPTPFANCIDMEELLAPMDAPGWDNYPVWGPQREPLPYYFTSYALAYARGLRPEGAFKVMEQFSGMQGHAVMGKLPDDRQVALWTNQALARGADAIFYFRWRTASFGQEQLCRGIRDSDDVETSRERAILANKAGAGAAFAAFSASPPRPRACLVYDRDSSRVLREQPATEAMDYRPSPFMQCGYDAELARAYAPFVLLNVDADVKSARSVDLDRYSLVSLPLYLLADPAFAARLEAWVRGGGTLVLGWRSGARTLSNRNVDVPAPGVLASLAGVRVRDFEALGRTKAGLRIGLLPTSGEAWADVLDPGDGVRVAARYRDAGKPYSGSPAITVRDLGRGRVWYLGTSPSSLGLLWLYRRILRGACLKPRFHGVGVEVVRRVLPGPDGEPREFDLVLNHGPRARRVRGVRVGPYDSIVIPARGLT